LREKVLKALNHESGPVPVENIVAPPDAVREFNGGK